MVWMAVGDNLTRQCVGFEDVFPEVFTFVPGDAGIDAGPAVSISYEPDIDVVEDKRKRKPEPFDAGNNGCGFTVFRGGLPNGYRMPFMVRCRIGLPCFS